jgi:hypothetical protein
MNGPGDHKIKRNKSGTERQILHNFTHVKPKRIKLIEVESKIVITGIPNLLNQ